MDTRAIYQMDMGFYVAVSLWPLLTTIGKTHVPRLSSPEMLAEAHVFKLLARRAFGFMVSA